MRKTLLTIAIGSMISMGASAFELKAGINLDLFLPGTTAVYGEGGLPLVAGWAVFPVGGDFSLCAGYSTFGGNLYYFYDVYDGIVATTWNGPFYSDAERNDSNHPYQFGLSQSSLLVLSLRYTLVQGPIAIFIQGGPAITVIGEPIAARNPKYQAQGIDMSNFDGALNSVRNYQTSMALLRGVMRLGITAGIGAIYPVGPVELIGEFRYRYSDGMASMISAKNLSVSFGIGFN